MPFDLIGDVHGHAAALGDLLAKLGYHRRDGHWSHGEGRRLVFLGDYIDRGPEICAVLTTVRELVDDGLATALMGNHEFNAIAYATRDPDRPGDFCRRHSAANQHQHQATLDQMAGPGWESWLTWMRTLPVAFQGPGFRAVHACWHPRHLKVLDSFAGFPEQAIIQASRRHSPGWEAVEAVLKGLEVPLPIGHAYTDKDGTSRTKARIQWWRAPRTSETLGDYLMPPREGTPGDPSVLIDGSNLPVVRDSDPAVFVGHYWMTPTVTPKPLGRRVACLDYSVAKGGRLCAYRWDPDRDSTALSAEGFVTVGSR